MPFEIRGRFLLDAIVNVRLTTAEKDRLKEAIETISRDPQKG